MGGLRDEIKAMVDGGVGIEDVNVNQESLERGVEDGEVLEQQRETESDGGVEAEAEVEEGQEEVDTSTDDEGDSEPSLEERYSQLLEAYNAQSAQLIDRGIAPMQSQEPTEVRTASTSTYKINRDLAQKALTELDVEAFEQIVNEAVQYGINQQQELRKQILLDLPGVATRVSQQQISLMRAVESFYQENADLKPFQNVVGAVANEIVAKEPQLGIAEVFQRAEQESRRRLGLKKKVVDNAIAQARKPAFAKVGGSRKPGVPKLGGIKADIAAMMQAQG